MWAEDHNRAQPHEGALPSARSEGGASDAPAAEQGGLESDRNTCIICEDAQRTVRMPCGHALLCEPCTKRLMQHSQPCPTCRSPFKVYYRLPAAKLKDQPAFLNPASQAKDFGQLRRVSTAQVLRRVLITIRSNSRACANLLCSLLVLTVLLVLLMSPLGLGVAEVVVGAQALGEECDQPLARWVIALGVTHLASWLNSVWSCCRGDTEENQARQARWKRLYHAVLFVLLLVGASYTYNTDKCDDTLRQYCFYFVTLWLCVVGFVVLMSCVSCCVHCAAGPREGRREGGEGEDDDDDDDDGDEDGREDDGREDDGAASSEVDPESAIVRRQQKQRQEAGVPISPDSLSRELATALWGLVDDADGQGDPHTSARHFPRVSGEGEGEGEGGDEGEV